MQEYMTYCVVSMRNMGLSINFKLIWALTIFSWFFFWSRNFHSRLAHFLFQPVLSPWPFKLFRLFSHAFCSPFTLVGLSIQHGSATGPTAVCYETWQAGRIWQVKSSQLPKKKIKKKEEESSRAGSRSGCASCLQRLASGLVLKFTGLDQACSFGKLVEERWSLDSSQQRVSGWQLTQLR
jgi:hypothetical protein